MSEKKELLKVDHLSFGYQEDRKALSDVSFSIFEGENVALIGHNGSGKSTLAKALMGLLEPNGGMITFFGLPLNRKNLYEIRGKIGIFFQNLGAHAFKQFQCMFNFHRFSNCLALLFD